MLGTEQIIRLHYKDLGPRINPNIRPDLDTASQYLENSSDSEEKGDFVVIFSQAVVLPLLVATFLSYTLFTYAVVFSSTFPTATSHYISNMAPSVFVFESLLLLLV